MNSPMNCFRLISIGVCIDLHDCLLGSAIFQAVLEHILPGLKRVSCRLDDILLSEKSVPEHLQLLGEILKLLDQHGVKLKKSKCVFLQSKVEYLGHGIDEQGIHPLPEKVEAIRNAPVPRDVSQLKSYLGLLNYYAKVTPRICQRVSICLCTIYCKKIVHGFGPRPVKKLFRKVRSCC